MKTGIQRIGQNKKWLSLFIGPKVLLLLLSDCVSWELACGQCIGGGSRNCFMGEMRWCGKAEVDTEEAVQELKMDVSNWALIVADSMDEDRDGGIAMSASIKAERDKTERVGLYGASAASATTQANETLFQREIHQHPPETYLLATKPIEHRQLRAGVQPTGS